MKLFKWNLIDDYDKMCLQNGLVREYKKRLEIIEKEDYIKTIKLSEAKEEIERLNNIINKAIEYINSFDYYIPEDDVPELLDILKGE